MRKWGECRTADQCIFEQKIRVSVEGKQRSKEKVLEEIIGQGSKSGSWYLSFKDL